MSVKLIRIFYTRAARDARVYLSLNFGSLIREDLHQTHADVHGFLRTLQKNFPSCLDKSVLRGLRKPRTTDQNRSKLNCGRHLWYDYV